MQRSNRAPAFALATVALALAGVAVSAAIYGLHRQLASDVTFGSFCNINAVVNCDVVLTSTYAKLLGIPVAVWGGLYYLVLAAVATVAGRGTRVGASGAAVRAGRRAAQAALLLACFGLLFSGYMAVVALFVIGAVCLMCSALYVVAVGTVVSTWKLRTASIDVRVEPARQRQRQRQDRWLAFAAATAVALVVGVVVWKAVAPGAEGLDAGEIAQSQPEFYKWYQAQPIVHITADEGKDLGPANAPVTIVAYSDFECGHCAVLAQSLHETLPRYHGLVRVVFHHFPLDHACNPSITNDFHRSACRAALAAECAAAQQHFWPYHDLLFANQQHLDDASLQAYAAQAGLDHQQFEVCMNDPATRERVARDIRSGTAAGVESTPTWFINGRVIKGALPPQLMAYAIGLARAAVQTSAAAP